MNPCTTTACPPPPSSVVTFNVANALTGGGGQAVVVQGFTGAYAFLNGLYTTASATATTVTAAITAPNVGQTNLYATMTVQPTYVTGGVTVRNGFVDQLGLARPVAGIGPLSVSVPSRLVLETKNVSFYWYETGIINNIVGLTARAFQGVATVGEIAAGALPADVIGFIAEYPFQAF